MPQRKTRQLEAVWESVCQTLDHPTAEQIFARARRRLRSISRGTVYRNLQKLVASGRLLQVRMPDGVLRFDATTTPHDHFVCDHCGEIADIPASADVDTSALVRRGFEPRVQEVTWRGMCPRCRGEWKHGRKRHAQ